MASQLLFVPHLMFLPKIPPSNPSFFTTQKPTLFHSNSLALQSASNSRITKIQAIADTCSQIGSNDVTETAELTLQNICQGFVPEHILHRMEESGFVYPTDIQREALPTLFIGRDCILHAQVHFSSFF